MKTLSFTDVSRKNVLKKIDKATFVKLSKFRNVDRGHRVDPLPIFVAGP